MSRSRRKPYYKDRGLTTHEYWSVIRHEWKQKINENYYQDDFYLRPPKSIISDWDYFDYWFYVYIKLYPPYWNGWDEEDVKKYSRK